MHSVLIVDDDSSLRPMLAAWVNRFGYAAVEADSAETALQRLDDMPADIALCDVNMPGHDGVWLAARIRERFATTAVIMATSVDDVDVAVSTLKNDVVDYLLKPFDSTRLGEALSLGLDWHRASVGDDDLHHALQDRLRTRRAAVASTLAGAQRSPQDAVDSLIAMLQLHEKDGRGHATRVARLAVAVADELGVDDAEIAELECGAMLHDVGKLDMPAEILSKPAPLTDAEWKASLLALRRDRPRAPRGVRRQRLSLWFEGQSDSVRRAHSRHRRFLRFDDAPAHAAALDAGGDGRP